MVPKLDAVALVAREGPRIIFNADDLGIHPAVNAAIGRCFQEGVLSSATLLVTTPYCESAVDELVHGQNLPVGLHVSLTLGRPAAEASALPDLVDDSGWFHRSALELLRLGKRGPANDSIYRQIETEAAAQLARARNLGVMLTHVDSHQHVHMNPEIFRIVEAAAREAGVNRIRWPFERFRFNVFRCGLLTNVRRLNLVKWFILRRLASGIRPTLTRNETFIGILNSGNISLPAAIRIVLSLEPGEVCDVGIHPADPVTDSLYPYPKVNAFLAARERVMERDVLLAPELVETLSSVGAQVICYSDIAP